MLEQEVEDTLPASYEAVERRRAFGLPVIDSLLPDGVPVPCSILLLAEPGSGSDIVSTSIVQEHVSSSLSVPYEEQKVLWLALESFVNDLRSSIEPLWIGNKTKPQIVFIDCYSSQVGIDSKETYSADATNLPYLSMVTSTAMSELNNGGRLLVVLDSLTSLIQKVGVRRSLEFMRTLMGKTHSISADLITSVNRTAFADATVATFTDIADLVIEMAVENNETSVGRLHIRKARGFRYKLGWSTYQIDFARRTLQFDALPSLALDGDDPSGEITNAEANPLQDHSGRPEETQDRNGRVETKSPQNALSVGPYWTFTARAIAERERLAILGATVNAISKKYQDTFQALERTGGNRRRENTRGNYRTMRLISKQLGEIEKSLEVIQNQTKIYPSTRRADVEQAIQEALLVSTVPSNVGVAQQTNGHIEIQMDPALVTRAISGVIEAAIHDMPMGGSLSIRNYKDGDMAVILVQSQGLGNWNEDLSSVFDPHGVQDRLAGLGLIIARKFVEAHGGQLRIQGEKGKGTAFSIRLPV